MTGVAGAARPGHDAVTFQPAAGFGHDIVPGNLDAPVHEQQRLGGQLRRDRVHRVGQPLPVARQRAAGDDWHDVLRGLQVTVVGEQDQVAGGEVPVGGVQHRDVDHAVAKRGDGLLLGVEGQEAGEAEPVYLPQPGEAVRPVRAFGSTAEGQPAGGPPQVADRVQAQAAGGGGGDHHAVLVLGRGWCHDLNMPPGQRAGQCGLDRRGFRYRDAAIGPEAVQRGPEIFGNDVHQALFQGRLNQLARPEVELELRRDPGVPDGQLVDRRQQLALRKVERGDHHRATLRAATVPGRHRTVRAGLARGEQREHQRAGRQRGHTSASGHGLTFFAASACGCGPGPVRTAVRQ